jgi:hypothetical protein
MRVITKLPNFEQSYKGKVKTHKYINRQVYIIRRNKYLVVGRDRFCFVNNHSDSTKELSETEIINMLEFFIENTFAICYCRRRGT